MELDPTTGLPKETRYQVVENYIETLAETFVHATENETTLIKGHLRDFYEHLMGKDIVIPHTAADCVCKTPEEAAGEGCNGCPKTQTVTLNVDELPPQTHEVSDAATTNG